MARLLITTLSTSLGIEYNLLIAAMRDKASVKNIAIQTLFLVYPDMLDVGCFSHTLNHVGERFNTPVLHEFSRLWIVLLS